jgi:hypothetical protein
LGAPTKIVLQPDATSEGGQDPWSSAVIVDREKVRQLHGEGNSVRVIAAQLGLPSRAQRRSRLRVSQQTAWRGRARHPCTPSEVTSALSKGTGTNPNAHLPSFWKTGVYAQIFLGLFCRVSGQLVRVPRAGSINQARTTPRGFLIDCTAPKTGTCQFFWALSFSNGEPPMVWILLNCSWD